jgi:hypothetical protein
MSKKEFSFNLAEKMAQAKKELNPNNQQAEEMNNIEPSIQSNHKKEKQPLIIQKKMLPEEPSSEPKLFVSGRLNRKDCNYVARSLHISESLLNDINQHCKGSESAIYNYLLNEGLKKIKESPNMIHVDIKEMEDGAS